MVYWSLEVYYMEFKQGILNRFITKIQRVGIDFSWLDYKSTEMTHETMFSSA